MFNRFNKITLAYFAVMFIGIVLILFRVSFGFNIVLIGIGALIGHILATTENLEDRIKKLEERTKDI